MKNHTQNEVENLVQEIFLKVEIEHISGQEV